MIPGRDEVPDLDVRGSRESSKDGLRFAMIRAVGGFDFDVELLLKKYREIEFLDRDPPT